MKKYGFSLVELMVTLIIISTIISAMTPMITKKLKSQAITVGSGGGGQSIPEFSQECSAFGSQCALCYADKCTMCNKECLENEYTEVSTCSCKSCDIYENCLECTSRQCKKCENGYYLNGTDCEICPIGSYCDGITKTTCPNGKYTDSEGQTSCKDCEVGYYCTNGIKSPCASGYYTSSTAQSSCSACEIGYYCPGASNKIKCSGATYQDETAKSSCKDCSSNGYYVSNNNTACNICEAGNMCTSGVKTQCSAGKYSSAGASSCTNCTAGKYSSAGSSSCTNCTAGKYSSAGASSCTNCSAGYYSSAGASSCTKCPAGKYSTTAGATSCTTCPKGYYCTGGTNKTSCGDGKYLDTTGNDASSDCKSCSSKTANCTKCNLTTGACSVCKDRYKLVNGVCEAKTPCEDIDCGELALCIELSETSGICMTKYNIGDKASLPIPSGVTKVTAGSGSCTPSETKYCCWTGTTTNDCDANNGNYSGCTRTVCDWRAANKSCSELTYGGRAWRLPTSGEWTSIGTQLSNISIGQGSEGLMLCDLESGNSSTKCYYESNCPGVYADFCNPNAVWSGDVSGSYTYNFYLTSGVWHGPNSFTVPRAFSVRCVSDL